MGLCLSNTNFDLGNKAILANTDAFNDLLGPFRRRTKTEQIKGSLRNSQFKDYGGREMNCAEYRRRQNKRTQVGCFQKRNPLEAFVWYLEGGESVKKKKGGGGRMKEIPSNLFVKVKITYKKACINSISLSLEFQKLWCEFSFFQRTNHTNLEKWS